MAITTTHRQRATVLTNPDGVSLKRAAWAYGCAKKDSAEEAALLDILLAKAAAAQAAKS